MSLPMPPIPRPSTPCVFTATLCSCGFPIGIIVADFAERLANESRARDRTDHQRNIEIYGSAISDAERGRANELLKQYGIKKTCCKQRLLCAFCLPGVA